MPLIYNHYDPQKVDWRHVTDPTVKAFRVEFYYSLLGYDIPSGRLDMLLRYVPGAHCRRHRHRASTMTLVLEGEQHLDELQPDGTTKRIIRKKGNYALSPFDALPHDEWGGPDGGIVLYSLHAPEGAIFQYFSEDMTDTWTTSVAEFAKSWEGGTIYGWRPEAA